MSEPADQQPSDRPSDHSGDHPGDPGRQRISDAERQQVADALQRAAGDGRLDLDELEERLEATWAARTYLDLAPILVDLPDTVTPSPPGGRTPDVRHPAGRLGAEHAVEHASSTGVLSEQKRAGVWRVPAEHTATAIAGTVTLDLREAVFEARETVITANAVLGAVEVHVDSETAVVIDGTPVLGTFEPIKDKVPAALHDESPVVRVTGVAVLGTVSVVRKRMPGEKKRR